MNALVQSDKNISWMLRRIVVALFCIASGIWGIASKAPYGSLNRGMILGPENVR